MVCAQLDYGLRSTVSLSNVVGHRPLNACCECIARHAPYAEPSCNVVCHEQRAPFEIKPRTRHVRWSVLPNATLQFNYTPQPKWSFVVLLVLLIGAAGTVIGAALGRLFAATAYSVAFATSAAWELCAYTVPSSWRALLCAQLARRHAYRRRSVLVPAINAAPVARHLRRVCLPWALSSLYPRRHK